MTRWSCRLPKAISESEPRQPIYPVHVFGTNTLPPYGQCCAVTSFVENAASPDSTTVIAFEGLASANLVRSQLLENLCNTEVEKPAQMLGFLSSLFSVRKVLISNSAPEPNQPEIVVPL